MATTHTRLTQEGTVPSTFRIPKATITGVYGRVMEAYARRTWGQVPDNAYVLWHHRGVLKAVLSFEQEVAKWDRLDPTLKSYAQLASAGTIGCSWCLDFGYFLAHNDGLDLVKVREVPRWRESGVFTPLERDVLEYAEAMTETPPRVTDELFAPLLEQLGAPAMVELTAVVGFANMTTRGNTAMGIESQGFSKACKLPLAQRSAGYAASA